ncbi:hypothetical protein ACFSHP_25955 [Novosphingobium panipatense]
MGGISGERASERGAPGRLAQFPATDGDRPGGDGDFGVSGFLAPVSLAATGTA